MPAVKSSSFSMGSKPFAPYCSSLHTPRIEQSPFVRIYTPSLDDPLSREDTSPFDSFDDSQFALSQWPNAGPLFTDSELYGSASPCPPSYTSSPSRDDNNSPYDSEHLEDSLFSWSYEGSPAAYDAPYSSYPESSTSGDAFSPSISIVSCSPRSDTMSLSPQPAFTEYSNAFNFDFSTTHQFPTSSGWSGPPINHSPKSSTSHSPSLSCSSLDPSEIKTSPSREPSPSQLEVDPQQSRRRFPCLILGCERRFTSQYTLKVHMEAHKPKPRVSFPCTLGCSERFSRQHDRLRHEVAKHGKVCEFSCDECGRFFSTRKTLGNHKCPVAQGGTRWVNN